MRLIQYILYVFGAYPSSSVHLFHVLIQEKRNITLPINTSIFPIASFNLYKDAFSRRSSQGNPQLPSYISPLYSQYLLPYGLSTNNFIEVHPFDYYILRFLYSIHYLKATKIVEGNLIHQIYHPNVPIKANLATNLFVQYINFIIKPDQPTKPSIESSFSAQSRPDMFLLQAVNELWLNVDCRIPNNWKTLLEQSIKQSLEVGLVVL